MLLGPFEPKTLFGLPRDYRGLALKPTAGKCEVNSPFGFSCSAQLSNISVGSTL